MSPVFDGVARALLATILVLTVALGVVWLRRQRERRAVIAVGLLLALAGPCAAIWIMPSGPTPDWVHVLHEGTTADTLSRIYGFDGHHGELGRWIVQQWSTPEVPPLVSLVQLHILLSLFNIGLFVVLCGVVLRGLVPALLLAVPTLLSSLGELVALSEIPAAPFGTCVLLAALPAALLADRARARRLTDVAALVLLALLTVVAAALREEYALVGIAALGAGLVRATSSDARLARTRARFLEVVSASLRVPSWWNLAALAVVAASLPQLLPDLGPPLNWVVHGVSPLNPSIVTLPISAATLLPVGHVVLIVLGLVHGLRHPLALLAAAPSAIVLYRIYFVASHSWPHELNRYLATMAPLLFVLAPFGWRELAALGERHGWSRAWRPLALVLLALLYLAHPPHGARELLRPDALDKVWDARRAPIVLRDLQAEARLLLDLAGRRPECAIVAPVTRERAGSDRGRTPRELLAFLPGGGPAKTPEAAGLDAALAGGNAPCAFLYLGLDCSLEGADGCAEHAKGREPFLRRVLPAAPYNEPNERGATQQVVDLRAYLLGPAGKR